MEETEKNGPLVTTRGPYPERVKEVIYNRYTNHLESLDELDRKLLEKHEKGKSDEQLAMLDYINEEAMELMVKYGREPYKVPHENFHLITTKAYREKLGLSSSASAESQRQGIAFKHGEHRNNLLLFGHSAFHEVLHLLAPLKFDTSEDDFKKYRQGVSILTLQKDIEKYGHHEHFRGLHEAIVSTSSDKFFQKLLEHPLLKKQKEWIESENFKNLREEKCLKFGFSENEILWINKKGTEYLLISYHIHQRFLQYICEEIHREFSEKYQNSEKVFEEFERAHFTGKLFEIARLIEKTFGKGSFRSLGDMDETYPSASRKFEEFSKLRRINNG